MEAVGRLAGGIAHDFNNVLTAIFGYTDLLRDQLPEGDSRRADLDEIRRSAERAASLTRQLLAFSRKQVMQPRVLDLNEVVENVQKLLTKLVGDDVALDLEPDPDLWRVKADPGQVEQVLMNLAANARDAMPEGGRLVIATANVTMGDDDVRDLPGLVPGDYARMRVTDSGEGMSEDVRRNIFEPFFTTKEQGKGTGLGLATVYGIVKQTGGSIWVYSEPRRGTTFKVYLPRHGSSVATLPQERAGAEVAAATATVLLVEDHEQVRTLVHMVLEKLGYTVVAAASGGEALAAATAHEGPIDMVLTDLVMPGMDGKELVERMRDLRPGIRALFTSGDAQGMVEGHELGEGDAFLPKPYDRAELATAIGAVLAAPAA